MENPNALLYDRRIVGKQAIEIRTEQHESSAQADGYAGGKAEACADAFAHPVIFLCAEVLTGKGSGCNSEGGHRHPEQSVNF